MSDDVTYVNPSGQPIDPLDPARQVTPPKKTRDTSDGFHKGFRVLGYPPGAIAKAKEHHEKRRLEITRSNIGAIKPQREPGMWSETAWKQANRPKPVRSKPYEIESAAVQCMRLAERAGWTDVQLVEVKKEPVKKEPAGNQ